MAEIQIYHSPVSAHSSAGLSSEQEQTFAAQMPADARRRHSGSKQQVNCFEVNGFEVDAKKLMGRSLDGG
jgi:hypothetical protein